MPVLCRLVGVHQGRHPRKLARIGGVSVDNHRRALVRLRSGDPCAECDHRGRHEGRQSDPRRPHLQTRQPSSRSVSCPLPPLRLPCWSGRYLVTEHRANVPAAERVPCRRRQIPLAPADVGAAVDHRHRHCVVAVAHLHLRTAWQRPVGDAHSGHRAATGRRSPRRTRRQPRSGRRSPPRPRPRCPRRRDRPWRSRSPCTSRSAAAARRPRSGRRRWFSSSAHRLRRGRRRGGPRSAASHDR